MTWDPAEFLDLVNTGALDAAIALAVERCEQSPGDAEAWFLLGTAHHRQGREDDALDAFLHAQASAPDDVRAASAIGAIYGAAGRTAEALAVFEAALKVQPRQPRILINAAIALEALGRDDEALAHYDRALEIFSGMGDALQNRAALNLRLGRLAAAAADGEQLASLFPTLSVGHYALGACALAQGQMLDAAARFARAIELDPEHAEAWAGRAVALATIGQLDAANAALAEANRLDAGAVERCAGDAADTGRSDGPLLDPRRIYLLAAWARQGRCAWRDHDAFVDNFDALIADSTGTPAALVDRQLLYAAYVRELSNRADLAQDVAAEVRRNAARESAPFVFTRSAEPRIRLGYLSANFHERPATSFLLPILAHHDRERFELYGYALQPSDGATQAKLAGLLDHFDDLSGISDAQAARQIHTDGIDVLIDSTGYLPYGRAEILAMRPAPLRISYAGFPGSLGPGIVDYRITDVGASPDPEDGEFAEALIRLPHAHLICERDQTADGPALRRADFKLPEGTFIYVCHHQHAEIEPRQFALWMRILDAVPDALLWLPDSLEGSAQNLCSAAIGHGVDAARLRFTAPLGANDKRVLLGLADLYLDTRSCGAPIAISEALTAGLPIVTAHGGSWAGRIGASEACAAGLGDLVCSDGDEYVATAVRLAGDPPALRSVRARLQQSGAPLFDTARRVEDYERGIIAAWSRYRSGLPPSTFDVEAR